MKVIMKMNFLVNDFFDYKIKRTVVDVCYMISVQVTLIGRGGSRQT